MADSKDETVPPQSNMADDEADDQNRITRSISMQPQLYNFRIGPQYVDAKKYALQLPFSTLFDNLIAVLWSVYSKQSGIQCGINQIQWALQFLKCLKKDYSYPENIGKIVKDLEKQTIELYAKVSDMLHKMKLQKELDEEQEINGSHSQNSEGKQDYAINCLSYNEKDIMEKLNALDIPIDTVTGEAKFLKELNSLGGRKPKPVEKNCKLDNKSSKTFMIGALQKILSKTSETDTKTEVEELIKELKIKGSEDNKP